MHNLILHSTSYTRVMKRNSYTVKYKVNGGVRFGHVLFYAKASSSSVCKCEMGKCSCNRIFLAFIKRFDSCTQEINEFPGVDNFLKVNIAYIHAMKETSIIDVIHAGDILALCIEVYFGTSVTDTPFMCEFPNLQELD